MNKQYTEEQIIAAIKSYEGGREAEAICRELGIAIGTFYNWRTKYAGMEVNEAKRIRVLKSENNQLRRLLAEKAIEIKALKGVLSEEW